jgi:type I restriction enzyme S subunit
VNVSTDKVPFVNGDIQLEISKSNLLINGDVVFADTAEDETVGKCTEISGVGDYAVVSGLHTIPVRPKFEFAPLYLGYFHNSESYHTQLLPLMQGVKVLSVSKSAIADTLIYYPTSIEEQKLIGEYFNNLDCIIEAKRDRIVKLRNIKKACLEKMFVNNTTEQ